MKQIEVVAAIIHREEAYFATQRGYGEWEGMWEFWNGGFAWTRVLGALYCGCDDMLNHF